MHSLECNELVEAAIASDTILHDNRLSVNLFVNCFQLKIFHQIFTKVYYFQIRNFYGIYEVANR